MEVAAQQPTMNYGTPGNRDAKVFDMLRGFTECWHVIEGRHGPGSERQLKHVLWANLHDLDGSKERV